MKRGITIYNMKTLCINLDSRPDRWAQASAEFERVGLTVERVSAVTGDNKPLAFNQSVLKCMQIAVDAQTGLFLFEDDVVFDSPIIPYPSPKGAFSIHLGCNIMGQWEMPKEYDEHFALLPNCWQSHATYYSGMCMALVLDQLSPDRIDENNCIFDEWFRRNILPIGKSYVLRPMIAYQRPSFSDIWNTQADYIQCHIDGNKYLATL